MNKEDKVDQVFSLLEQLRETLKTAAIGFVTGGRILHEIQRLKLYPRGESFYGFITDNVGLGRSTINDRVNAWKRFGTMILANDQFQGIDPTKLRRLLPHVRHDTPDDEKEDLLHAAASLSVKDLQAWLLERIGHEPCGHTGWIELVRKCRRCGKVLEHIRDDANEIIERSVDGEKAQETQAQI